MPHTPHKLLVDAIAAAEAIGVFTLGRTRLEYGNDLMLRSAVERQFEILGEALRRLQTLDPGLVQTIGDHRRIIAFRNVIAYGYDSIDDDIVWQVVADKLPSLLAEARRLLADLGG
jgi:uncharacterized protein with HEPN domain